MCLGLDLSSLLSPIHSRRVHPALSGYDKGLQCLVVEAENLNVVDLLRVAPSVPAKLRGETIRRRLLCNRILRRIAQCCAVDSEDGSVLRVHIVRRSVSHHPIHNANHTR